MSSRIKLQLPTFEDGDFLIKLVNSEGWLKFIGDKNVRTKEEAERFITDLLENPNRTYWIIRLIPNDEPIGVVSLVKRPYLEYRDIGFALLPEFAGLGLALEASQLFLKMLKEDQHLDKVLATIMTANSSSIRLIERLGFAFQEEIKQNGETLRLYSKQL